MADINLYRDSFQNWKSYGFEIDRKFYQEANEKVLKVVEKKLF